MSVSSWTPSPPLQPLQNHFLCFLPAARGLPTKQIRHPLMNHSQVSPRSRNQKQTGLTLSRGNFEGKKESEKVLTPPLRREPKRHRPPPSTVNVVPPPVWGLPPRQEMEQKPGRGARWSPRGCFGLLQPAEGRSAMAQRWWHLVTQPHVTAGCSRFPGIFLGEEEGKERGRQGVAAGLAGIGKGKIDSPNGFKRGVKSPPAHCHRC